MNWYFAIEVWACVWAIGNMHWASTKLKLIFLFNKLVCNVYVVKQLRQKRFVREILSNLIPEHVQSNAPFKSNIQGQKKK